MAGQEEQGQQSQEPQAEQPAEPRPREPQPGSGDGSPAPAGAPRREARPARVGDAVLFCLLFLAGQLVLGFIAGIYMAVTRTTVGSFGFALLEAGSFFVVVPFIRARLRTRILPLFRGREPSLAVYGCIVLVVAGVVPAFSALDALLNRLVRLPDFLRALDVLLLNPDDRVGTLVLACLAAPVFEETLFRGVMLKGVAATSGTARGLLVVSALFAVVHINPLAFPATFLLGLLLGTVCLRTGSLVASIVMHGLYNAGAIALAWLPGKPLDAIGNGAFPLAATLGIVAAGLAVAGAGAGLLLLATRPAQGRSA